MIIFIIANLVVALCAFIWVRLFFPRETTANKMIIGALFFWAQVIFVGQVLGIAGMFSLLPVLLTHSVILLSLLIPARKEQISAIKLDFSFFFQDKLLLLCMAVFLGFFIPLFIFNLINPPMHVDCLHYHIAFPAFWLQQGNLDNPVIVFGVPKGGMALSCVTYYPINAHLFFAWLMMPLKNAMLADVGETPFYFLAILLIYSILRKYGLRREIALFFGLFWVLIPTVLKQMLYGSNIDVICAAGLLLVLHNLLMLKEKFELKYAVLLGISVGIFVGIKLLNIVWLAALAPLIAYYWLRPNSITFRRRIVYFIAALFCAVIFGGYIYIKNMFFSGNPAYPVSINLFGHNIFKGMIDNAGYSKILRPVGVKIGDIFWKEGLGGQFLLFILPATFIPLCTVWFKRQDAATVWERVCLFIAPLLMLLMYIFVIHTGWVRYLFPYLALGLIVAAVFLKDFTWHKRYIYIFGTLAVIASMTKMANSTLMFFSLLATLIFMILFFVLLRRGSFSPWLTFDRKNTLMLIIAIGVLFYFVNDDYVKNEFSRYPYIFSKKERYKRDLGHGWSWLEAHTGKGKRIAFAGRSETYPLFGRELKNQVFYLPVNNIPMAPYAAQDPYYRKDKDYAVLAYYLRMQEIDYIFVAQAQKEDDEYTGPDIFSIEDGWCRMNPQEFKLVFSNSLVHIYQVVKSEDQADE